MIFSKDAGLSKLTWRSFLGSTTTTDNGHKNTRLHYALHHMTKDPDDRDTPPKERRQRIKQTTKSINVRLTQKEWSFLNAASNALNKTISVLLRDGAKEKIERESDLRFEEFEEDDPP